MVISKVKKAEIKAYKEGWDNAVRITKDMANDAIKEAENKFKTHDITDHVKEMVREAEKRVAKEIKNSAGNQCVFTDPDSRMIFRDICNEYLEDK